MNKLENFRIDYVSSVVNPAQELATAKILKEAAMQKSELTEMLSDLADALVTEDMPLEAVISSLADAVEVPPRAIREILTGENEEVTEAQLSAMAPVLGVEASELIAMLPEPEKANNEDSEMSEEMTKEAEALLKEVRGQQVELQKQQALLKEREAKLAKQEQVAELAKEMATSYPQLPLTDSAKAEILYLTKSWPQDQQNGLRQMLDAGHAAIVKSSTMVGFNTGTELAGNDLEKAFSKAVSEKYKA